MVQYGQLLHIDVFFPAMTRINVQGFPPPVVGPVRCRPEGDPLILDEGAPQAAVIGGVADEPVFGLFSPPLLQAWEPGNRVRPNWGRPGGPATRFPPPGDQRPG